MVFISNYLVGRRTLLTAFDEDMTDGEYAFIMLQLDQQQFINNQLRKAQYYVTSDVPFDRTCDYYQAMESVIVLEIEPTEAKNETHEAFDKQVRKKFQDPTFPLQNFSVSLHYILFVMHIYFLFLIQTC